MTAYQTLHNSAININSSLVENAAAVIVDVRTMGKFMLSDLLAKGWVLVVHPNKHANRIDIELRHKEEDMRMRGSVDPRSYVAITHIALEPPRNSRFTKIEQVYAKRKLSGPMVDSALMTVLNKIGAEVTVQRCTEDFADLVSVSIPALPNAIEVAFKLNDTDMANTFYKPYNGPAAHLEEYTTDALFDELLKRFEHAKNYIDKPTAEVLEFPTQQFLEWAN